MVVVIAMVIKNLSHQITPKFAIARQTTGVKQGSLTISYYKSLDRRDIEMFIDGVPLLNLDEFSVPRPLKRS